MIPLVYIKCKIGKFFISSGFLFLLGINILVVHAHNPSDQNESFIQSETMNEPAEQQIDSAVREGKESCCNKDCWLNCCTCFVCTACITFWYPCEEDCAPFCNGCNQCWPFCRGYPCCPYWDKCVNVWCPHDHIENEIVKRNESY